MIRDGLRRRMRKVGWAVQEGTLRYRLYSAACERGPGWDWGKTAMWLVGRCDSGSIDPPRGRDLFYVRLNDLERVERSWFVGQQDRLGFITTTARSTVRRYPAVGWKVFGLQDNGRTIRMGYWPTPGSDGRITSASIEGEEIRLFWRWYWISHRLKAQWLGIRPWIYYRGLRATVHQRKPFACNQVPHPGAGHTHWHCEEPRRHRDPHRYRSYVWTDQGAVAYRPKDDE